MLIPQLSPAKLLSLPGAAGKLPTHTNTIRRATAANQYTLPAFMTAGKQEPVSTPLPAKLLALANSSARSESLPRNGLLHTVQIPTALPRWCLFAGVIQIASLTEIMKKSLATHTDDWFNS
jgi:hypothetical protein